MDWLLIIGLILGGLVLLVLEVMVIPGVGVVGFFGFGMIIFSFYRAFADHGTSAGVLTVVVTFFVSVLVIWFALRSKTWKRITLTTELPGKVNTVGSHELKEGDRGVTIGRISPMGKVRINGKFYEVKSGGAYIDPDRQIEVTLVDGSEIHVKEIR
jgi:membrane-bound ClpP family serine protease